MAGKFDLNKFYEDTKININNIQELDFRSRKVDAESKEFKIYTANLAAGMLAQLCITSNAQTPYIGGRMHQSGVTNGDYQVLFLDDLKRLKIYSKYKLNPSIIPLIQRYRSVFDTYEKQHGIQNPFVEEALEKEQK